jgi:hypothetical protein
MDLGELLTRWTIRVAMLFYVASLATRPVFPKASRLSWTAGGVLYLLHVACAFHYYHHWSHDAAFAFTAEQTAQVTGLDWGGGLYVDYAFTLAWLLDAAWWWASMETYLARPRWINWLVQGFLGFIAFNATVVFAEGFSRWFGIAACVLLAVMWFLPKKGRRHADSNDHGCTGLDRSRN